jgi:hypothetical protein
MTDLTPLDNAHAIMEADAEDEAKRLRFYDLLAQSELYLLLSAEPEGDQISPELFELSEASFVLAFDREHRLTDFTGRASPYAALSGRAICELLAQNGLGLGLNLEVAPSSILLPPEAMRWMAQTLDTTPEELSHTPQSVSAPKGLPQAFLLSLDSRLASAAGLAEAAYLVAVTYENGVQSHLLGVIDVVPGAEPALAQAVSDALTFSGLEAATLDVAFFAASDPVSAQLAKSGLRFDLPKPEAGTVPSAPGMDPEQPPILR